MFGLGFASHGYFVSLPDYAGYGISSDLEHPYTYHPELAIESADMALAARELTKKLGIKLTKGIYLGGWSGGGGASLATQKYLERYHPELPVIASAELAGPYHISRTAKVALEGADFLQDNLRIYNWAGYTYNKFSETPIPANQIWKNPVQSQLDAIAVPSKLSEIYKQSFLNNRVDDVVRQFKIGDIQCGWVSKGKVFLYVGMYDTIVPPFNSLDAYNCLTKLGGDIELYKYPGNHYTPQFKYYKSMLKHFNKLSISDI